MKKQITHTVLRLFALFLLLLITCLPQPVSANYFVINRSTTHAKAYLKNRDTNGKIELPVEITESDVNSTNPSITAIVNIATTLISKSAQKQDPTASVKVVVTMWYQENWVGQHTVAIDRTTAVWTKSDNTVTIINATVSSAVRSDSPPLTQSSSGWVGTPSLGVTYVNTPPWNGIFAVVDDIHYQESMANCDLKRGSGSTWNLFLCVSKGGTAILGCE